MKKKLVSILMATMVCASAMTGCGSAAGRAPEDVETEAQIPAEILEAAEDYSTNDTTKDVVGTDKDYVFNPETLGVYNDEDVADAPNKSHQEIAEEEQLDINIVKMIEEQFDPVAVAADEYFRLPEQVEREGLAGKTPGGQYGGVLLHKGAQIY